MSYAIAPCTIKAALKKVEEWHRHLPDLQGGLFAAQVILNGECVGVGVFGNPSRVWQNTGRGVISRCAAKEDLPDVRGHSPPASTMLYRALFPTAKALAYPTAC